MSKIVLGRDRLARIKEAFPLTVNIVDEKRQALAYNMLYHMMENGAEITVNGKRVPLNKDLLYIYTEADGEKSYKKPHMDSEWYGANGQNFENGNAQYTTACMGENGKLIMFAPFTSSYEKVNEMSNFMILGFDPSVSISCVQNGEMKPIVVNGRSISESIVNDDGQLIVDSKGFDRDWAQGKASEITYDLAVDRKYELLMDDTKKVSGGSYDEYEEDEISSEWSAEDRTVYRIRALRDFGDVKAGDLGGYIESDFNLSHSGNCWVYDEAAVCNDAVVRDYATVRGAAEIKQAAVISGNARVFGDAQIADYAQISGHARVGWEWDGIQNEHGYKNGRTTVVCGDAKVSGHAQVLGEVILADSAIVKDHARIDGKWPSIPDDKYRTDYICGAWDHAVIDGKARVKNTYVRSNAHIRENAFVSGHPTMGGHVEISGNAEIGGNARIMHNIVVNGNAKLHGTAEITEKVRIGHDADIQTTEDFFDLKSIGKTSSAFRNQSGDITVVHKGKTYDSIEQFKAVMADSLDDKGRTAIEKLEEHFHVQRMPDLGDALANLQSEIAINGITM